MKNKSYSFNLLEYSKSLLQEPLRLSDTICWQAHIPFAFMLIDMLRPKLLVELGTYKGDSYLAFCQAVESLRIDTKCFAVDNWQGDEHGGFYEEKVYKELKDYHDPLYKNFSTLIRKSFDEALENFTDGTVDLLHIDGLHTYEAVRHDFETWLPKVSQNGIVLFHDTAVRERDFGVWKFWGEIKEKYPGFEFKHGNGLGIIAIGEVPEPLKELFSAVYKEPAAVTEFFHKLGLNIAMSRRLIEKDLLLAEKDRQIQALLDSWSWKITAPIRKIMILFRRT